MAARLAHHGSESSERSLAFGDKDPARFNLSFRDGDRIRMLQKLIAVAWLIQRGAPLKSFQCFSLLRRRRPYTKTVHSVILAVPGVG